MTATGEHRRSIDAVASGELGDLRTWSGPSREDPPALAVSAFVARVSILQMEPGVAVAEPATAEKRGSERMVTWILLGGVVAGVTFTLVAPAVWLGRVLAITGPWGEVPEAPDETRSGVWEKPVARLNPPLAGAGPLAVRSLPGRQALGGNPVGGA
jgi:hypothetical protein